MRTQTKFEDGCVIIDVENLEEGTSGSGVRFRVAVEYAEDVRAALNHHQDEIRRRLFELKEQRRKQIKEQIVSLEALLAKLS